MTGARPRWWVAWSSKRVVSVGGMFCAFFGSPGTDGGSTGAPRAAPAWEMVVRWVKECRINELAVLLARFHHHNSRKSAPNQLREHLDPGHENNTHFRVKCAAAPAISMRTRTRGTPWPIPARAR